VPPPDAIVTDGAELVSVKSGEPVGVLVVPVPVSATDCGEFEAIPEMVRFAPWLPAVVGANVTVIVQFALAVSVAGQLFVCLKSPETVILEIVKG
jgi:hypothetical protein